MKILIILIFLFLNINCAPALIISGAYKSAKTKEQRQDFMTQFQKTNTERETKGLKPLDWCSEAYKFDEGWANNDKNCAKKIKAYKNGDKTALKI